MTQSPEPRPPRPPEAPLDPVLAALRAHPSYEAVRGRAPHREPSPVELEEHLKEIEAAARTKAQRIAGELDAVIKELKHQARHNAPAAPGHISRLEAIRKLLG